MRILVVDGQRTVGGGQVMTRHILRVLAAAGHEVAAAVPDGPGDLAALLEDYRVFGFPHAEYTRGRKSLGDVWRFATGFFAARAALVRIMREWRPDLVYIQNSIPVPYAVAAAEAVGAHTKGSRAKGSHAGGVPVVAHLHIRHTDAKSRALLGLFLSRPCVRAIVAPSAYTLGQLPPRLSAKFRVVHNFVARQDAVPRRLPAKGGVGVPAEVAAEVYGGLREGLGGGVNEGASTGAPADMPVVGDGVPERVPVVAMMGDVCEAKGQHILLEAATAVVAAGVPLRVRIAGPIVDEGYAARLGAMDGVRMAAAKHHPLPDASDKRAAEHPILRTFGGRATDNTRMGTAAYPFPRTLEGERHKAHMKNVAYPLPSALEGRATDDARHPFPVTFEGRETDSARMEATVYPFPVTFEGRVEDGVHMEIARHPFPVTFEGRVEDGVHMEIARHPFPVTFEGRVEDGARMETAAYPFPVTFEGRVADGARWVAGADLVVCPSRSETFCLSMVEAWAQGVPTLASRGSGMRELVEKFMPDMADAMLFERENRAELARKMARLLTDPALYAAASRRALATASTLNETAFTRGISEVIQRAAAISHSTQYPMIIF